jgi:hypothetical protein
MPSPYTPIAAPSRAGGTSSATVALPITVSTAKPIPRNADMASTGSSASDSP